MFCYDAPNNTKEQIISNRLRKMAGRAITEKLYLFVFCLYVLKWSFETTLYYIDWPTEYEMLLRLTLCVIVLLKIGSKWTLMGKEWMICFLTVIPLKFSWLSTEYDFLLDTALLIAGAAGISYRKILKVGFWGDLYVLLIAMVGSFAGCIDDLFYLHKGHSFGGYYPTDFAAHALFLFLVAWILYGKNTLLYAVCSAVFAFVIYGCCGARCSVIISCLLAVSILYLFVTEKHSTSKKILGKLDRWINICLRYMMPFCALVMISLTILYDEGSSFLVRLNALLTGRLQLGHTAIDTYGIKSFGTAFTMVGAGGTTALPLGYDFVDSSYIMILVRYGAIVLAALFIQYIWMEKKAIKAGLKKLAWAAALIAVHSVIEHHLLELTFNLLLVLPFADFENKESEAGLTEIGKQRCLKYIACIAILLLTVFPWLMDYLRTIVDVLQLNNPENHIRFMAIATIGLSTIILFIYMVLKVSSSIIKKRFPSRWDYAGTALLMFALLSSAIWSERIIQASETRFQNSIDADALIIDRLLSADESIGKLYVDHVPEIYRRKFKEISYGILAPEKAPFRRDMTLIADNGVELQALTNAGFLYGEIYSGRAIYTNSAEAEKILTENGILLTNYYSKKEEINLIDLAVQNGLETTREGTLLLSNSEKSLHHGPGVTVCSGKLQVEYSLRLINNSLDSDVVATAAITSYLGERTWIKQEIRVGDFDEDGQCLYQLETWLGMNCSGMEFPLFAADGVELEVIGIKYGKIR